MTKISSEPGTIAGWRSVTKETILEKVKAYIHRASPEWPGPKMIFRPSGQGEEFFFVSGHQRVVALHKYLQWCHATDASPHDFLLGMAASVPCAVQEIGAQEACMEGLKRCVQTVHGTTGFTAFSLYVLMRTHKINFPEFKASIGKILPEWAGNTDVFPWQRLLDLSRGRVSVAAVEAIDSLCSEYYQTPVFSPEWFRGPLFLLPGQRAAGKVEGFTTALEQELWVERTCAEVQGVGV